MSLSTTYMFTINHAKKIIAFLNYYFNTMPIEAMISKILLAVLLDSHTDTCDCVCMLITILLLEGKVLTLHKGCHVEISLTH